MHFPTAIFLVFIVPVVLFLFISSINVRKNIVRYDCMSHSGSRANGPCAGVQGARSPLPRNQGAGAAQAPAPVSHVQFTAEQGW